MTCVGCLRGEPDFLGMHRQLANFFETPNQSQYLALRATLLRDFAATDLAADVARVGALIESKQWGAAQQWLARLMPAAALSPRIHFLSALVAEALGQTTDVELSRFMFQACLQGVLATGDGSPARPYQITYTTDEYDILEARKLRLSRQVVREKENARYDVFVCASGAELWFDVTHLVVGSPQQIVATPNSLTPRPRKKQGVSLS